MNIGDFGYNETLENLRIESNLGDYEIGRVIAEHKERYVVTTTSGEFDAEISGNLRFSGKNREDFPAVGDWVSLTIYEPDLAIIHALLPRVSVIARKAVGKLAERQIIAANIDYAFIVQAVDRDFNINRIERYLVLCSESKVSPIIVLTKTDLIEKPRLTEIIVRINNRLKNTPIVAISNENKEGYDAIERLLEKGKTYCLLGSSGVGKSSLTNNLSGRKQMKTDSISESTGKGRHITSHRKLIVLENGAILIDNPGMREVGIIDAENGIDMVFDEITRLSADCKYPDCTHTVEKGCAVLQALENGSINKNSYDNFLKMEKEKAFFETSLIERKNKEKFFGKMLKNYYDKDVKGKRNKP